jgi:hypothetical protein
MANSIAMIPLVFYNPKINGRNVPAFCENP